MLLPQARTSDLVEMEADGELLIYDLRANKVFQLNETSKIVFRACNSYQSFDDLKRQFKFSEDLIYLALSELKNNSLIDGNVANHFPGLSRREIIKRAGLSSMVALPLIASIATPNAANAASTCPIGRCVAPNDNFCADCNQERTYNRCTSTDGTCTGCTANVTGIPFCQRTQNVTNISGFDFIRV